VCYNERMDPLNMTKDEMAAYLRRWQTVAEKEIQLRRGAGARLNLPEVIRQFAGLFAMARKTVPLATTTGLVTQQALFQKLRHG
jgi:hypothetical protein